MALDQVWRGGTSGGLTMKSLKFEASRSRIRSEEESTGFPAPSPVIARSACDEAIQFSAFGAMDCFPYARNDGQNHQFVFATLGASSLLSYLPPTFPVPSHL